MNTLLQCKFNLFWFHLIGRYTHKMGGEYLYRDTYVAKHTLRGWWRSVYLSLIWRWRSRGPKRFVYQQWLANLLIFRDFQR